MKLVSYLLPKYGGNVMALHRELVTAEKAGGSPAPSKSTKKRALTSKREKLLTFPRESSPVEYGGTVPLRVLYVAVTMSWSGGTAHRLQICPQPAAMRPRG